MPQPPSGTVTFLFTDIERSTQLWDAVPQAMQLALERHDTLLRTAIDAHGGYVVKTTGDGVHAAFGRAGEALAAAIEMQQLLAAEPWPDGAVVRVRIGVHTGEASERDGDYFGTAVNHAARLMAVANGGQVVCSQSTATLAGDVVSLRSLGEHRLRDLAAAEQVFQVGDGAFPPLRSVDAVPTNLPTVRTELIGRTDDVTTLMALAERERLVTLTGVGGVGKTRLALGVAAALAVGFTDGCWLVELSPVADGDEVLKTVAAAIRAPATTIDTLADYLADRRVLIVLDNCEHVLDAAADLVDAILAVGSDVHVLVTSREPLGLDGEQVRRVQSLTLPSADAAPAEAETTAAVRLFAERAAAVSDGFAVDAGNVEAVVEICRHLDGIPLAIELAAARVRAMAPAEIARRLDERFRLLAGGSRRSQERHRTLLATVSWSHDLLTDDEKVVFRRLAVFPASFDLAAAEAVAGEGRVDVVDCVLRLVDRSLVMYEPDQDRYRLLETLRQFGADRLAEAGETEAIRGQHAQHFLAFCEQRAPETCDARYAVAHAALTAELDNLRSVADWCAEQAQWAELLGMARGILFFLIDSAAVDGTTWYGLGTAHADALDPQAVADALGELSWMTVTNMADYPRTVALAEESIVLAERDGLAPSPFPWLARTMVTLYTTGDPEGVTFGNRAVEAARARDDACATVLALGLRGTFLATVDRAAGVASALEGNRLALQIGQPSSIISSVLSATGCYVGATADTDFDGFRAVLESAPELPLLDTANAMWFDLMWGAALVYFGESGALERLARAIDMADRHGAPHAEDMALRLFAIAAGNAGNVEEAAVLSSYCDATFVPYRMRQHVWIAPALEALLERVPDRATHVAVGAAADRRQILALVTRLESELSGHLPSVGV